MNSQQRSELVTLCRSIRWDVDMGAYSTFRTGGTVEAMVESGDLDELVELIRWLHRHQIPWQVIGGGSNILVTSAYHEGVFIRLGGGNAIVAEPLSGTETDTGCRAVVGAGCNLAALVAWCTRNGLVGLEFMAGIPGSVGGAIRMNAGAFDHSISEALESVQWINEQGQIQEAIRADIIFSYRHTQLPEESSGKKLITRGAFLLQRGDREDLAVRCREIIEQRRQRQPWGLGSAGSVFKNPTGDYAGRLIEQAGFKGVTFGKAMVSPQHANFIVNTGGAVPEDIIGLMQEIRRKVLQQSGVLLEPEVHIF